MSVTVFDIEFNFNYFSKFPSLLSIPTFSGMLPKLFVRTPNILTRVILLTGLIILISLIYLDMVRMTLSLPAIIFPTLSYGLIVCLLIVCLLKLKNDVSGIGHRNMCSYSVGIYVNLSKPCLLCVVTAEVRD